MSYNRASIYNQQSLGMVQLTTIHWRRKIQTDTILYDIFEDISEEAVRAYQKSIGQIWEIFEVTRGGNTWSIYKSHDEIQDFIIDYNLRFKSKLVFDLFLSDGLHRVCQNPEVHEWPPFNAFVEVQDSEMGKIGSYVMLKKSGGRFKDYFCCRLPWQWQKRNFVIIKAGILYYAQSTKEIKEYLPFGSSFKILCGKKETGYGFGIRLEASHRKLLLFTPECRVFCKFVYQVKETIKQVEGPQQNPYESFAPTRQIQQIEFLIDGQKYFEAVYQALERAEWQIMICGWMISPEFQLRRPVDKYPDARLDSVLEKAAKNGIKIFILVYNESSFLTNDSTYTKETLERLSPNIKVLQHPLGVLPSFWSHHEKAVIIDQNEVLMGGLDLCYGRFDTSEHKINHNDPNWYPGIQYNNIRTKDLMNVREFWKQSVARDLARLPWHDVGVHFSGEIAQDVCHHFIEYWNYASFQTHYQDRYLLILQKDRPKQPLMKRIKKGITSKIETIKHLADELKQKLFSSNAKNEKKEVEIKVTEPSPIQIKSDDIKIEVEPKMVLELESDSNGKLMVDRKQGRESTHSAQSRESQLQSNRTYRSNRSNDFKEQMLAYQSETTQNNFRHQKSKKTVSELDQIVENMEDQIEKIDYINDIRISNPIYSNANRLAVIAEEEQEAGGFSCQILRSVGSWSIGCSPSLREQSIHNAYLSLISSAKHFVYIQNQFFVSAIEGSYVIKNQIANAIYDRILTAYYKKEAFKVYVVLPLIPGFAGELDDPEAVIPRVIMHWQYRTIGRGESSLLGRLKRAGVNPDEFIVFLSLRTHGVIQGVKKQPATEIVYLHSKLMIVDDRSAIIGSANLNDRSMRGSRDSQLCLLVQGRPTVKAVFNNQQVQVNKIIQNLRLDLWREHFGSDLKYEDPVSMECLHAIKKRAKQNTMMYREVFHCYPDDQVTKLNKLMEWRVAINQELYEKCFNEVKGFVVEFPMQFLKEEDLLVGSTLYPDILSV